MIILKKHTELHPMTLRLKYISTDHNHEPRRAGRSGDRIPVGGARYSAPVQPRPGGWGATQPPIQRALCLSRVERPGRGVNHPPPFSAEVKERVELYTYSPSVIHDGLRGEVKIVRVT